MKAACFLAQGFEESEAVITIDLLKRAGIDVTIVGVEEKHIKSTHGVIISADVLLKNWAGDADCFILPGGVPGVNNLYKSDQLKQIIQINFEANKLIAAICAAPAVVLDKWGLLKNKKATGYPSMKDQFKDAVYSNDNVVIDGNLITSKGVGTAMQFALAIIKQLLGESKAEEVKKTVLL